MKLILASKSPRRAALLKQAGLSFSVVEPWVDESKTALTCPRELVAALAEKKARAAQDLAQNGLIIAADTVVVHQGKILGKPADEEEARFTLELLSGQRHEVYTGLALLDSSLKKLQKGVEKTSVWMRDIDSNLLQWYLASGEPYDKAGAYGIQGRGAVLIKKISGCYTNVVGLPLALLFDLAQKIEVTLY